MRGRRDKPSVRSDGRSAEQALARLEQVDLGQLAWLR